MHALLLVIRRCNRTAAASHTNHIRTDKFFSTLLHVKPDEKSFKFELTFRSMQFMLSRPAALFESSKLVLAAARWDPSGRFSPEDCRSRGI